MRARSLAMAATLACAACAETQQSAPPPPMALISDMLLSLSLVQAEGAIHIVDPGIVARPAFDPDRSTMPEYPIESLRAREHGEVTLELCVSEAGVVVDSAIAKSSSHERLDQASLAWVNAATFTPARTSEGPVTYSLCLDAAGNILNLRPVAGRAHWTLTTATLNWLRSLKYSPANLGGEASPVCGVKATYEWKLPDTTPR